MTGKIYIIGIGPGSSEYLTKKAVDTVKASDYTVGSTRAIELFDEVNNKIAFNVKELVENAIDAGASSLVVEIQSGGMASIGARDFVQWYLDTTEKRTKN